MKTFLPIALVLTACASSQVASTTVRSAPTVVTASEANWEQLNPARGDKSPMAATLWGDRNGTGPTGFLFHPVDGFESPPHAHNVSYRGVVIRGLVHNADPDAEEVWMPNGSYWTQPKGGVHITAAKGNDVLAYIEIDEGPYLVLPVEKAFEVEDKPVNVDESDITWTDAPGVPASADGPKVSLLWGDPLDAQPSGSLVRLPAGFSGAIRGDGESLRAVVIQGLPRHGVPGETGEMTLDPGSYVRSEGESMHPLSCEMECVLYVRTEGGFGVVADTR
jgi:hypothetical protein